jgi:hypothetical protein
MPPGIPPKMEYGKGEMVPFVVNEQGSTFPITRWRCMSCGAVTQYSNGQSFGHCASCAPGERWGFVDARMS